MGRGGESVGKKYGVKYTSATSDAHINTQLYSWNKNMHVQQQKKKKKSLKEIMYPTKQQTLLSISSVTNEQRCFESPS